MESTQSGVRKNAALGSGGSQGRVTHSHEGVGSCHNKHSEHYFVPRAVPDFHRFATGLLSIAR